jgi:hypothetical protein
VATKDVAGETGTLCCSEMTENSTAVSNPINLIPIVLDTVVISTTTGETGIGGYAVAAESFPAADNTREHQHAAKIRRNFLQLLVTISIHLARTLTISTVVGETSIGGYNHVVGSFSATDKGSALSSAADADDRMEHAEATVLTPKSSVRDSGDSDVGETSMFTTPGDIPPQAFVRLDQFTTELIDLCADFRVTLQQAIGALSESINAQLASSLVKIHENTVHIDDHMWSQFEKVNKTATTKYEWLDKRLFIVERDMKTRIQVQDELRADLTETALQLHTE